MSDPHVIAQSLLIGKEETQLIASSCLCAAILIMRTKKRKEDFIKRSYRAKRNINSRSIPDPGRRVCYHPRSSWRIEVQMMMTGN